MGETKVENFRRACEKLGGELTESGSLVKCDLEELKVTLRKDEKWMKAYWEGRLKVWCKPRGIDIHEDERRVFVNYAFEECDVPEIYVSLDKRRPLGFISPPLEVIPPSISEEFMTEYAEKVRRAWIASRERVGRP